MTKNAIRLREKRKNASDEEKAKEAKRKKDARDAESRDKTNDRNARNAERMKNSRKSGTDEEKAAKKAANAKRMREKRAAEKLAKTKNEDSMSEYERLRLKSIQERQQKFKEQFDLFSAKTGKKARSKPEGKKMVVHASTDFEDDASDINAIPSTSKNITKRSCTLKICKLNDNSESDTDTSLDEHINDLLESVVANDEIKQDKDAELMDKSELDSLIPCHAPLDCCK